MPSPSFRFVRWLAVALVFAASAVAPLRAHALNLTRLQATLTDQSAGLSIDADLVPLLGAPGTADFLRAPARRATVTAAIQRPFYTDPEQAYAELPVVDGIVQRAPERDLTKVATVDRYHGNAAVGKMFWTGLGPKTPDSALACSVSHDLHNIIVVGTSDAAMATAVNAVAAQDGGWALVKGGEVIATVRFEIGGLMSSRPPLEVAAELEKLYAAADTMEWIGAPGLPRTLVFSLITCSPFTWRLVVPYEGNPDGLVNLVTGEVRPILR